MRIRYLSIRHQPFSLLGELVRTYCSVRLVHVALIVTCSLLAAGCVSTADNKTVSRDTSHVLIARNFAQVLAQVPALIPAQTTLSIAMDDFDDAGFSVKLWNELLQAGYAVRRSDALTGAANHIDYQIERDTESLTVHPDDSSSTGELSGTSTYQLSVNAIGLRRTYAWRADGGVQPLGTMQGRGFDTSLLTIDDSLFESDTSEQSVTDVESPVGSEGDDRPVVNSDTDDTGDAGVQQNGGEVDSASAAVAGVSEAGKISVLNFEDTKNYRELGKSNYSQLFEQYEMRNENRFLFPNDSSSLGQETYALLGAIIDGFQPQTDIVAIVGSSHGKTDSDTSQEGLARARALVVRDAVMQLGVPENRILVEASWSEDYYDKVMPRRGAVVGVMRIEP